MPMLTTSVYRENLKYFLHPKVEVVVNQGGTRCFAADQLIITDKGSIPVSQVQIGDMVLTDIENKVYKPVVAVNIMKPDKKCLKITLKNGKTIKCTEDHKFWFDNKWMEISEIIKLWKKNG
jgi:hypothetical protein